MSLLIHDMQIPDKLPATYIIRFLDETTAELLRVVSASEYYRVTAVDDDIARRVFNHES